MAEARCGPVVGIDLMGGDFAPESCIDGCLLALDRGMSVTAFGSEDAVRSLRSKTASSNLETVVTTETVSFDESPVSAIREKPDSSIRRGIESIKAKIVDAFVSAGSTGALVAAGVLLLGRAPGVDKPALATVLPSQSGHGVLLLDLGASADARPETLTQFAVMGSAYAEGVLGWQEPRVSLLNIGTEPEKGSLAAKKSYSLLSKTPIRFAGNIEARDVFADKTEVVVTDGFTGNMFIKTCEGTSAFLMAGIRKELESGFLSKVAAAFLRPAFRKVKALLDYSSYGGAPLLGLNGCVVKCHGPSGPEAIANGMDEARRYIEGNVSGVISNILRGFAEGEKS